jgi:hypothetical protein
MTYNCFRTRFKTKSKSTEDLIKSEVHQGIKLLSKTIKIIKTFLVLKYTKKINSLKEKIEQDSNNLVWKAKLEHELKLLSDAKSINHQLVSVLIVKNKIPFGSDPHYNPMVLSHQEELSTIDRRMIDAIINDRRLQDSIRTLQIKITSAIENNNKKRLMNENKKHPTSSKIDCSKAMFVDDLDERAAENGSGASMDNSSQNDRDLRKLNKSLRNQENRRLNKLKRESDGPYDESSGVGEGLTYPNTKRRRPNDNDPSLSMYRPLDQRLPSSDSSGGATTSNKRSMRNDGKNSNERLKKNEPNKSKGQQSIVNGGRSMVRNKGSTGSSADADSSLDLVKAAAFGKEWQKTGVHPSWAAKQHSKQLTINSGNGKSGSIQFSGKKIIFDD